jgi:hypothetical protein
VGASLTLFTPVLAMVFALLFAAHPGQALWIDFDGRRRVLPASATAKSLDILLLREEELKKADASILARLLDAELRRAIVAGFRDVRHITEDPDFDPNPARPDFPALLMDLAFPANSFAVAR